MPKVSKLTTAKSQILSYFRTAQTRIFSKTDLQRLLKEGRRLWRLPQSTELGEFISFLERQGCLKGYTFRSKEYEKTILRYAWGPCSIHALALSLKKRGYLTHGTAAEIHGLLKPSKTIYLNVEQSLKPTRPSTLTQDAINRAFANKQRLSKLSYDNGDNSVVFLSGKNTKQLGVQPHTSPILGKLMITNLPRTLIDITVRPAYAGGVNQVLNAYQAAKGKFEISELTAILSKLKHVYPYHQSIGFLMQATGYPELSYAQLRALGLAHDFYLDYALADPDYSEVWRLFFPRDLLALRHKTNGQVSLDF